MAGPAGIATLDLLRGYYSMLSPLLDSVACAPLPEGPVPRASSLHQRAWLLQVSIKSRKLCVLMCTLLRLWTDLDKGSMLALPVILSSNAYTLLPRLQLHALELHRADVALSLHSESVEMLLRELFSSEAPNAATDGARRPDACSQAEHSISARQRLHSAACKGGSCCSPSIGQECSAQSHKRSSLECMVTCHIYFAITVFNCAGMGQGRSRMVDLLELVTSATPAEPQLGRDAHPEVRRMLQVRHQCCSTADPISSFVVLQVCIDQPMCKRCTRVFCMASTWTVYMHATAVTTSIQWNTFFAGPGVGCAPSLWHHCAAGRRAYSQHARRGPFRRDCAQG